MTKSTELTPALRYVLKYSASPSPSQTRKLDLPEDAWAQVDAGAELRIGLPDTAVSDRAFVLHEGKLTYPTKRAWTALRKKVDQAIAERRAQVGESGVEWTQDWPDAEGFFWFFGRRSTDLASTPPELHIARALAMVERTLQQDKDGKTVAAEKDRLVVIVDGKAMHSELGCYGLFAPIHKPHEDDLPDREFEALPTPAAKLEQSGPVVHHVRGGSTACGAAVPTNPAFMARSGQLERITCFACRQQVGL